MKPFSSRFSSSPLCLDVQHAVRDGKFHVPVRVDARELGDL
jgi:hypothetical protein